MYHTRKIFIICIAVTMISIILWQIFIPIQQNHRIKSEMEFWSRQKNIKSIGTIEMKDFTLRWEQYRDKDNKITEFVIYIPEKNIEGILYETQKEKWFAFSEPKQYVLLSEMDSTKNEISILQGMNKMIVSLKKKVMNKEEQIHVEWEIATNEQKKILMYVEDQISKEEAEFLRILIQAILVKNKQLASRENIEGMYQQVFYEDESLLFDQPAYVQWIIQPKQKMELDIRFQLSSKQINYKNTLVEYNKPIEIPDFPKEQAIPIEEYLLFR